MKISLYQRTSLLLIAIILTACGGGSGLECAQDGFLDDCIDEPLPPLLEVPPLTIPAGGSAEGFSNTVTIITPALDRSDDVYVGGILRSIKIPPQTTLLD